MRVCVISSFVAPPKRRAPPATSAAAETNTTAKRASIGKNKCPICRSANEQRVSEPWRAEDRFHPKGPVEGRRSKQPEKQPRRGKQQEECEKVVGAHHFALATRFFVHRSKATSDSGCRVEQPDIGKTSVGSGKRAVETLISFTRRIVAQAEAVL